MTTDSTLAPPSGQAIEHAQTLGLPADSHTGRDQVPLLSVDHLSVAFMTTGAMTQAVDDLCIDIMPGDRLALVGESGSGKTVSALSILRLLPEASTTGRLSWTPRDRVSGRTLPTIEINRCSERELRAIRGRDIAMIFQEPMSALNPLFTVGDQIAEVLELHEGLRHSAALARAVELLDRTGVDEPARRAAAYPHQLSGGQRQRVVIAMALACSPQLLIADEPTTALDVTIREQVLDLLLKIQREDGMAILLITHDLPLVERFAQRVGVMQQGRLVEHNLTETLFALPQHPYTRQLLDSRPQRMVAGTIEAEPLLQARGISCTFDVPAGFWRRRSFMAVRDASMEVHRGETLGIVGESGSGKTTLALSLLRLNPARVTGRYELDGTDIGSLPSGELRKLRRRMQVVFQDPFSSLSPRMTVGEIIEEGLALHFPQQDPSWRQNRIAAMLDEVGLPRASVGRYPHEFSGGQRQRIAIARAVILQPDLVVLDEPTSALDVSIQQQVLELLVRLQRDHGMAYLFITHDLAVIRAFAHRVLVMHQGGIVESGPTVQLLDHPQSNYTRGLIRAAFSRERMGELPGPQVLGKVTPV
jgi:microcin C transport system ATP-binding protein